LIEFCEESGSPDLPYYMESCSSIIGGVDLVVCLDSGAGNYDQFWTTVSLRGMISCNLKVEVLNEGVHSGSASGVVPSSFRLIRQLISRLENEISGEIKLSELNCKVPEHRMLEAEKMVEALNGNMESFPWHNETSPMVNNSVKSLIGRTWKPTLSIVGAGGIPSIKDGGNVLRPFTELKLSFRLPPTIDSTLAMKAVTKVLRADPPNNATISIDWDEPANGWSAPKLSSWLENAIEEASQSFYNQPAMAMGEGGTIPFMAMLGEQFPNAQFVITGVLGPNSNAHGPNEFIHIPFAKKLSACVAFILNRFPS
jgi:acetylornithine deacetylase/succinyl-diaminopimelate desuccinylase-like protein